MEHIFGSDLIKSLTKTLKESVRRTREQLGVPLKIGLINDNSLPSRFFGGREAEALRELGIDVRSKQLTHSSAAALNAAISEFNDDRAITGFLLHWPLEGITQSLFSFTELIEPSKDIDGLRPLSRLDPGSAALPPGFIMALDYLLSENRVDVSGADVCVVGRSDFVGRPLAAYLLTKGATVTVCHRRTRDLSRHTRSAGVVVTATGHPGLIEAAGISAGALVIDIGTTVVKLNGTLGLVGDVDAKTLEHKPGRLVPVPGGVGPLVPLMVAANAIKTAGRTVKTDNPNRDDQTLILADIARKAVKQSKDQVFRYAKDTLPDDQAAR
jgi:methylenetetrahydrofolate dehydrogenase (NADP+) / methenyltetrahydrofolate cyclohydrolase